VCTVRASNSAAQKCPPVVSYKQQEQLQTPVELPFGHTSRRLMHSSCTQLRRLWRGHLAAPAAVPPQGRFADWPMSPKCVHALRSVTGGTFCPRTPQCLPQVPHLFALFFSDLVDGTMCCLQSVCSVIERQGQLVKEDPPGMCIILYKERRHKDGLIHAHDSSPLVADERSSFVHERLQLEQEAWHRP
jgi:hypothetical protein